MVGFLDARSTDRFNRDLSGNRACFSEDQIVLVFENIDGTFHFHSLVRCGEQNHATMDNRKDSGRKAEEGESKNSTTTASARTGHITARAHIADAKKRSMGR